MGAKKQIKFWALPQGALAYSKQILDQEAQEFQKLHPELEVEVTVFPWRLAWERIITSAKKEQGPDVLQIGNTWAATLASMGILEDITEKVNVLGGEKLFVPASWKLCQSPGTNKINSVPWYVDVRGLYYRKDILAKFNLKEKDLADWNSFQNVCEKINNIEIDGKKVQAYGFTGQKGHVLVHDIAPWLWGAGVDFLDPEGEKVAFNSEPAIQGIETWLNLITRGYVSKNILSQSYEEVNNNFCLKGDFSMVYTGSWLFNAQLNPAHPSFISGIGQNCYVTLPPSGPKGRYTFCGGSNLAISSFATNPDEAWKFIKFLLSTSSQNRYCQTICMLPGLVKSFNTFTLGRTPQAEAFKEFWKYGRTFPNHAIWGVIELILCEGLARIYRYFIDNLFTKQILQDELNKMAQEANEILKQTAISRK